MVHAVALKCERNYISVEWLHKQISINALTNSLLSQEKWAVSIDYPGDAPQMCRNESERETERKRERDLCYALKMSQTIFFDETLEHRKIISEVRLRSQQSR